MAAFIQILQNDTTTHNYFPSWFDEQTILYTQSPETITLMNENDRKKSKIEGINADQAKYNSGTGKFVYVTSTESENAVILFDWKTKRKTIVVDGIKMANKF